MAKVYFGNCVNDQISVNLNYALSPKVLEKRNVENDGTETIRVPAVSLEIKANKDKGIFGNSATNNVQIIFATVLAGANLFDVSITNLLHGDDLYFYVFENTLVGQNQVGSSQGIVIEMVEIKKVQIQ